MDHETSNLKKTFQQMMTDLDKASKDLDANFDSKKEQLKQMCATFFAKI